MTTLQEAARKALEALKTCSYGDYSAKHVVDPSFDGDAVEAAIESLKAALAQQVAPVAEPTDDQLVKGVKAMRLFVTKNSVADFRLGYMAALAAAPAPQAQPVDIEALCARIKAADDAAAEGDYMLDSDDCISVIRGTWKAPMLNDKPAPQAQEPIAKLFGTLPVYDTPEPQAQDKSDNYLSGYCTGRTDLLKEQSAQPAQGVPEVGFGNMQSAQPVAQITDAAIREIADCIVSNLDSRKGVIDLDLDDDMVEEIMQEMCDTIAHGIREVK